MTREKPQKDVVGFSLKGINFECCEVPNDFFEFGEQKNNNRKANYFKFLKYLSRGNLLNI